jgi:hypothetical protein
MGWVDADAHVVESPLTWEYLLPSEQKFRPQLFKPEGETQKAHWVIDGKIRGLFRFTFSAEDVSRKSEQVGRNMTTTMATRDLADVAGRIKHMDELGIDVQVLYQAFSSTNARIGRIRMWLCAAHIIVGCRMFGSRAKAACAGWRLCLC